MVKSKISCSYKFSFFNKIFCNFMAGSTVWKVKLLYVLVLYVPIWKGEGAKLNAPKVLLPYYRDVIVNFTLKVERSLEEFQATTCYEWYKNPLSNLLVICIIFAITVMLI